VKRLSLALFATLCFALMPSSLFAQKVELFVGDAFMAPPVSVAEQPSYCPVEGTCSVPATTFTNRERLNGWEISATHRFTSSLALTVDGSGDYGLATSDFPVNGRARQYLLLAGPQFSRHGRFSPFVHALAGATYQSATASGNNFFVTFPDSKWGFAAAVGGGIDADLSPNFSFRILQADYVVTRLGGSFQSQPRISIGFLFRF